MNHCADCNQPFEPRQPYHKYCDACYARRQGWRPRRPRNVPWHPSWDLWASGDWIPWLLLIALPAIIIYTVGRLLGFW